MEVSSHRRQFVSFDPPLRDIEHLSYGIRRVLPLESKYACEEKQ